MSALRLLPTLLASAAALAAQPPSPSATFGRLTERASVLAQTLASVRLASNLPNAVAALPQRLNAVGLDLSETAPAAALRMGVKTTPIEKAAWRKRFQDAGSGAWIDFIEFPDAKTCETAFEQHRQPHSGTDGSEYFAFFTSLAPEGLDTVAAGVRRDRLLISIGVSIPFRIHLWDDPPNTAAELQRLDRAVDNLARMLEVVVRAVMDPQYITWIPKAELTGEDVRMLRIASFARLWSEVKYNFVFLDQRPELDWERMLERFLPRVMAAASDEEYAEILKEAIALLRDGHTGVQAGAAVDRPALRIEPVGGKPVVIALADTAAMKATGIRPGMELVAVEGAAVAEILKRIYPTVAASTAQSREITACWRLLEGPPNSRVRATFRDLKGDTLSADLVRDQNQHAAAVLPWRKPSFEYRELAGGIAYVALNSFGSAKVVKEFEGHLDRILRAPGLILDVRNNGGGSSGNGYQIVARLIEKGVKLKTSAWRTRDYKPAFRAWGRKEEWHEGAHNEIEASGDTPYRGPVAVLVGANTFSAAEDFLVPLKQSKRATLIGAPSGGSTGQPLGAPLFRAYVRICTKWDRFADGTEFVGVGVQPDIPVEPTQADIAAGRDPVLERAVELLRPARPSPVR